MNVLRTVALSVPIGVAAIALAACSSSGSSPAGGQSAAGSSPASQAAPAAGSGTTEAVTETEFHIAMPSKNLKAGTYTFAVKNAGSITHALTVDGPGVSGKTTGDISPGSSANLTVTLKSGKYDVFCPVGNHKMEGMDETVTVS